MRELRDAQNISGPFDEVVASLQELGRELSDTSVGSSIDSLTAGLQVLTGGDGDPFTYGDGDPFAAAMELDIATASIALECYEVDNSIRIDRA
jgi:hypothetical protein